MPAAFRHGHLRLLADLLAVVYANRKQVAVLLVLLGAISALEPAAAWVTKTVLDRASAPDFELGRFVSDYAGMFLLAAGGLALLRFVERIAGKAVEIRLIISLQRIYLDRRESQDIPRDVAQILYGCEQARKGAEIFYKDGWRIVATTLSVMGWQASLGAEWLPLMLLSVLPSCMLVWIFGPAIRRASTGILDTQAGLAAATHPDVRLDFDAEQERWFRSSMALEMLKWMVDEGLDILMWIVLALLVVVSWVLGIGLLPDRIEIGGAAAFLINARLLAKPLGDLGKVYTKWHEAFPSADRVFRPAETAVRG